LSGVIHPVERPRLLTSGGYDDILVPGLNEIRTSCLVHVYHELPWDVPKDLIPFFMESVDLLGDGKYPRLAHRNAPNHFDLWHPSEDVRHSIH
jgi:hypothetical protein